MNEPLTHPAPKSKRRRWLRIVLVVVLVLAGLYSAYRYTLQRRVEVRLDAIRRHGYPVTLAELDQWYTQPPSGENAAEVLQRAFSKMEQVWTGERYNELNVGKVLLPSVNEPALDSRRDQSPEKLAELEPEFFSLVPVDPFDGNPLHYRKLAKGYIVYSVGEDGKDDGGTESKVVRPGTDITFTVDR